MVLCIPESGENFQEKLAHFDSFKRIKRHKIKFCALENSNYEYMSHFTVFKIAHQSSIRAICLLRHSHFLPVDIIKWHLAESDGGSGSLLGGPQKSGLLQVSAFCYVPRIVTVAPGGAERKTGGGCCLVQLASGKERMGAGQEDIGECTANW